MPRTLTASMKRLMFYTAAGTVIALAAQALGAGLGVALLSSLLGPPLILLAGALHRYGRIGS